MELALINGPNLNFLSVREPGIYGNETLDDVEEKVSNYIKKKDCNLRAFQSNSEGALIDYIQRCYYDKVEGIIINAGAYTHYSYAIRDAIAAVGIPTVEIHISNVYQREEFRKVSVTKDVCIKQIYGLGTKGYLDAADYLIDYLNK